MESKQDHPLDELEHEISGIGTIVDIWHSRLPVPFDAIQLRLDAINVLLARMQADRTKNEDPRS
jgi:hypothetical protein